MLVGLSPLGKFSGYEVIIIFSTKQQNTEMRGDKSEGLNVEKTAFRECNLGLGRHLWVPGILD